MEKSKVMKIELKLQRMLKLRKQFQSKVNLEHTQTETSYVIRRRKGENDKRISVAQSAKPMHSANSFKRNEVSTVR